MSSKTPETVTAWTTLEKLLLAQAVYKCGDGQWPAVSRTLKLHAAINRPQEFFSHKVASMSLPESREGPFFTRFWYEISEITLQHQTHSLPYVQNCASQYNLLVEQMEIERYGSCYGCLLFVLIVIHRVIINYNLFACF